MRSLIGSDSSSGFTYSICIQISTDNFNKIRFYSFQVVLVLHHDVKAPITSTRLVLTTILYLSSN